MDLKKKLDSIERTEILYILAGALVIGAAAIGLQYQEDVEPGEDEIQVALILEKPDQTISNEVDVAVNSTVFDAVNDTYEVEHTEYDFGYFITSIDGLAQNGTHSWLYSVNNKSANTAVNNYILTENSNITFRYTDETDY